MDVTSKDQLLTEVEALKRALEALPRTDALERAIYHSERLHLAIRSSHNEGTRFAAFTVSKIVKDLDAPPTSLVDTLARIRATLEASGLDLHK